MSASSKLSFELFVLVPDVESHWHHVEQLAVCELAILPEIEEQCLFVANDVVVFEMVVYSQFGWIDLCDVLFLEILPTWK